MRAIGLAPWVVFYKASPELAPALLECGRTWWAWREPGALSDLGFIGRDGLVRAYSLEDEQLAHLVLTEHEAKELTHDCGIDLESVYVAAAVPELARPWPDWRRLGEPAPQGWEDDVTAKGL